MLMRRGKLVNELMRLFIILSKYCNYQFDNNSNLGGVRAAVNAPKDQQAP